MHCLSVIVFFNQNTGASIKHENIKCGCCFTLPLNLWCAERASSQQTYVGQFNLRGVKEASCFPLHCSQGKLSIYGACTAGNGTFLPCNCALPFYTSPIYSVHSLLQHSCTYYSHKAKIKDN